MVTQSSDHHVLIVGSGPVGATFARLLGRPGYRITMVDSGPLLSDRPGEHLANAFFYQQHPNLFLAVILSQLEVFSVPPNPRRLVPAGTFVPPDGARVNFENPFQKAAFNMPLASASYAVGGMGTHWTCCAPDPAPMEMTTLVPPAEWPVLLAIARKLLNVHEDAFSPSFSNEAVKEALHAADFPVTNLPMAAEKRANQQPDHAHMVTWTGTDTVLGRLIDGVEAERRRLTIKAEHRVERLIYRGDTVVGADVVDLTNHRRFRIDADTVVVAASPLLTPLVLWRSGIRPDALGRYLNANHTVSACVALSESIVKRLRSTEGNPKAQDPIPIAWDDPSVMLGSPPTDARPWRRQILRKGKYLSHDLFEQVHIPEPVHGRAPRARSHLVRHGGAPLRELRHLPRQLPRSLRSAADDDPLRHRRRGARDRSGDEGGHDAGRCGHWRLHSAVGRHEDRAAGRTAGIDASLPRHVPDGRGFGGRR